MILEFIDFGRWFRHHWLKRPANFVCEFLVRHPVGRFFRQIFLDQIFPFCKFGIWIDVTVAAQKTPFMDWPMPIVEDIVAVKELVWRPYWIIGDKTSRWTRRVWFKMGEFKGQPFLSPLSFSLTLFRINDNNLHWNEIIEFNSHRFASIPSMNASTFQSSTCNTQPHRRLFIRNCTLSILG